MAVPDPNYQIMCKVKSTSIYKNRHTQRHHYSRRARMTSRCRAAILIPQNPTEHLPSSSWHPVLATIMGVNISIIRDGNFRHPRYANFRPRHKYGLIPLGRAARNWCHEIITLDFKIRETVQREIYITEELEARRKSDPSEPMSDRERAIRRDWERDLKTLAKAYWEYERKLYHLEVSAPSEIAMRAYKTLREDEYWYLSSWLREDCIRRDGCCARQCGCCEKPRNTHRRLRLGHCTIEVDLINSIPVSLGVERSSTDSPGNAGAMILTGTVC